MGLAQRGHRRQRVQNVAHGAQPDHKQAKLGLRLQILIFSQGRNLIHVRTVEQWQLSGDSKTLTIKLRVDFPGAGSGMSSNEGQSVEEDKFTRESIH
jgi:hypothetical protein